MIDDMLSILEKNNVADENIFHERFTISKSGGN